MDIVLESFLQKTESSLCAQTGIYDLVDTYYQCVVWKLGNRLTDDVCNDDSFSEELSLPLEMRDSGIECALSKLLECGCNIDGSAGGFNALMLAVGEGDAPMVQYLIKHGADANSWPFMEDASMSGRGNYYLDDIDIHYMNECFLSDKDINYLEALYRTAVILAEEARLGPYKGYCLQIDEDRTVSFKPARVRY